MILPTEKSPGIINNSYIIIYIRAEHFKIIFAIIIYIPALLDSPSHDVAASEAKDIINTVTRYSKLFSSIFFITTLSTRMRINF